MASLSPISESDFLRAIPSPLVPGLEQIAHARSFSPGSTIFTEGTRHDEFHVVVSGRVRLDMRVPGRGRIPILTAGAGDVLAWSALLGDGVMTSSALALEPVQTVAFPGTALRTLCEQQHEIGYHVMRQLAAALSRRLVGTRLQLLDLFADHAPVDLTPAVGRPGDPEC
jgi:CRP-like cAMP-binding protein